MATACLVVACAVIHLSTASLVNVARGKLASMSSTKPGYVAGTAVDGNTDAGTYRADTIIDSGSQHDFVWWKVDLEREVQDAIVRIYFRTDYTWRRNGLKLYTSVSSFPSSNPTSQGQLCNTVTGDPSGSDIPDVYNVTCHGRWRYLLLYTDTDNINNGRSTGPSLDFGEVEVLGCSEGTYEEDCAKTCISRNCVNLTTVCDRDGRCPDGCQFGWTGIDCTECDSGSYGPSCTFVCTDRNCMNVSSTCDHVTGQCVGGCQSGYKELDCINECDDGVNYGVNCSKACTDRHCNQPSYECDTRTGQCIGGCQVGWTGVDCISQCPTDTFGSDCTFCTTRHCQGESDCPADGTCSRECQDGWTGNTCLQECSRGFYGPRCGMTCGNCSSDYSCHHVTGSCPRGCKAGWRREKCNEVCGEDTYGPGCAEKCGKCDGVCDRVDGRCPAGCLDGYCGIKCDLALTGDVDRKDPSCFGVASLVGAVVGSNIAVVLLAVGIHICLVRRGRLQWTKTSEAKQSVQESRDLTQMNSIAPRPADVSENVPPGNQVHNNDYAVLDTGQIQGNKDYDVIQPKHYQNL